MKESQDNLPTNLCEQDQKPDVLPEIDLKYKGKFVYYLMLINHCKQQSERSNKCEHLN